MAKINNIAKYFLSFTVFSLLTVFPALPVQAQTFGTNGLTSMNLTREGIYDLLIRLAGLALFILPGIALIFIIFGAFKIITGDDKGWALIKNSLIGLAIAGLSFLIVGLTTGLLETVNSGVLFG